MYGSITLVLYPAALTQSYTLSLHDALPILGGEHGPTRAGRLLPLARRVSPSGRINAVDRKSTRLNSSHVASSYAVFCLKKKKMIYLDRTMTNVITSQVAISIAACYLIQKTP